MSRAEDKTSRHVLLGKDVKMGLEKTSAHRDARKRCIFVIDDDDAMTSLLRDFLTGLGHEVRAFERAHHALGVLKVLLSGGVVESGGPTLPDLIVSDIRMPEMSGTEFLAQARVLAPDIPIILATAFGSIESALAAVRQGAYDYVVKPFQLGELEVSVSPALEARGLRADVVALKSASSQGWEFARMMGRSAPMRGEGAP